DDGRLGPLDQGEHQPPDLVGPRDHGRQRGGLVGQLLIPSGGPAGPGRSGTSPNGPGGPSMAESPDAARPRVPRTWPGPGLRYDPRAPSRTPSYPQVERTLMTRARKLSTGLVASLMLACWGCGGGGSAPPVSSSTQETSVKG